jgi:hypothetical protein
MARDWLKTLWPASFKGVPFFVESDEETGGRRIVIHQFPMRDIPYLEDLGEDQRDFDVTAYVASDSADSDAAAVVVACAARGAGALVLPTHGPLIVRCLNFKRERSKDKHGYIALELRFVREGASSAIAPTAMLANLIFLRAEDAAGAIARSYVANMLVLSVPIVPVGVSAPDMLPDFVLAAASDTSQDAVAILEAVRTTEPVEPIASAKQRDAIQTLFKQVPDLIADKGTIIQIPNGIVSIARALGDAMAPASAVDAFSGLANDPSLAEVVSAIPFRTKSSASAAANVATAYRTVRLTALTVYAEGIARIALADRPAGITLRANVAEYFEAELIDLPASELELFHAMAAIRDAVIEYLSRAILDLAPVLTVEANLSMPSLYWAWRLYQDPNRSAEIVARNKVVHPSFMPPAFEALAK